MDILKAVKKLFLYKPPTTEKNFVLNNEENPIKYDVRKEAQPTVENVFEQYDLNLQYIKEAFDFPKNNDVIIRHIKISEKRRAFIVFFDGMVDTQVLDEAIIRPLLEIKAPEKLTKDILQETLITHNQIIEKNKFEDLIDDVNFGCCVLFVEGFDCGFMLDVKKWEHRMINEPKSEQSLYGPKEAFSEILRTNSALIRKTLKTEKLICEGISIGKTSKSPGVLMYISDIADNSLVSEVRNRLNSISIDFVFAIEEVSLLIEDKSYLITNQILATERPDRVCRALSEGRVAFLLNGSPKALIFPTNVFELMHTASDAYMRYPYANMTRILRMIAMFITLLLPAFYLAITLYHQEMIPTFLAYAISSARESVPFPSVVELLLMDLSFELIREAGIRMPSAIGQTLGIVGGLILGQAAVSAKIVSPLMIIVIAITGIGSFATPDYSLGWSYRILRLIFILLASVAGFYGIALGVFVYALLLGAQMSFGVPFLTPLTSDKKGGKGRSLFVNPIWKNEKRPYFLSPKKANNEPKISRKWKKKR